MIDDKLKSSIPERVAASVADGYIFNSWEKIQREMFLGFYPQLNERQLSVCSWIIQTIWDLDGNGHETFYDEVVCRVADHKELFFNESEINDTIAGLLQQGVVHTAVVEFRFGMLPGINRIFELWKITPTKRIGMSQSFVEKVIDAMADCLMHHFNEYFPEVSIE